MSKVSFLSITQASLEIVREEELIKPWALKLDFTATVVKIKYIHTWNKWMILRQIRCLYPLLFTVLVMFIKITFVLDIIGRTWISIIISTRYEKLECNGYQLLIIRHNSVEHLSLTVYWMRIKRSRVNTNIVYSVED